MASLKMHVILISMLSIYLINKTKLLGLVYNDFCNQRLEL